MTGHALFPASPRAISKSLPESETQTLEPPQGGREDGNRIGFRHRRRSERVIPGNTPSFPISAVQNLSAPFFDYRGAGFALTQSGPDGTYTT